MADLPVAMADFLYDQEVWRVTLANLAKTIYGDAFNVEAFLKTGSEYLRGFLATLLHDVAEFGGGGLLEQSQEYLDALGLPRLTKAQARAVLAQAVETSYAGGEALCSQTEMAFAQWVTQLKTAGMAEGDILAVLQASEATLDRALGPWKSGLQNTARNFVKLLDDLTYQQAQSRLALPDRPPGKELHAWVTMYDGKVCGEGMVGVEGLYVSCWARHGVEKTYEEWVKFGLPHSGVTLCGRNCRCMLVPSGYIDAEFDGVVPEEPFGAGHIISDAQDFAAQQQAKIEAFARRNRGRYAG